MATLALAAAGAAIGGALLPAGVTLLGATITGATIGSQIGALAGAFVDQSLFGASGGGPRSGPQLSDLKVTASTEGAPIPRLYGRARLGGQMIWATDIEEQRVSSGGGGKGAPAAPARDLRFLSASTRHCRCHNRRDPGCSPPRPGRPRRSRHAPARET